MTRVSLGEFLAEIEPVFVWRDEWYYSHEEIMAAYNVYKEDPNCGDLITLEKGEIPTQFVDTQLPNTWVLDVLAERVNQIDKWGVESNASTKWVTILAEELGEVSEAVLQNKDSLKHELIQLVAAGVAWLEQLEEEES